MLIDDVMSSVALSIGFSSPRVTVDLGAIGTLDIKTAELEKNQ